MALSYATLFGRIGKLIKYFNLWLTYQGTTLLGSGSGADEVLSQYNSRRDLVIGVQQQFQSQAGSMAGWNQQLKTIADTTLQDLQVAYNAPNNSVQTILPLMVADMIANAQSVTANVITTPTGTAGSNTGNGPIQLSKKNVAGVDDQRVLSETVELICTGDQYSGASAGAEAFSITGLPVQSIYAYQTLGNGQGQVVRVADSQNKLQNGTFSSYSASNFASWTVDAGVAGTNVKQETSLFHSPSGSALKLVGDGTTTAITMHQNVAAPSVIAANTIYVAGVWLRKNGTVTGGSNLKVWLTGSGFSEILFNADPSTLTTAYQFFPLYFSSGATPPPNISAQITWTAANTAGASAVILMGDFVLATPTAFGSFGATQIAIFRGSTDFIKGDSFAVVTANNNAGVFQSWFSRVYNTQLPTSGSPTILDSLAT